jgi:orotate phosphoribosyltransferase
MQNEVIEILKQVGAVSEGHFIGTSGKHLSVYINKNKILVYTDLTSRLCKLLAEKTANLNPDVVVAPATGGIALSQWTAHHLSEVLSRQILSVYTEKNANGEQSLEKRGYDTFVKGKNVLVVEDIVNTGKSVGEVVRGVKAAGGNVISAVALVNRNKTDEEIAALIDADFHSLALMPLESYGEEEVPDWLKKIPINTELGHGAKYLKEHGG